MTPLALYVHWPFCKSKCPYCDFNSHVRERVEQEQWRNALITELKYAHQLLPARTVTSIFFGGGTPSLMPPETVAAIIEGADGLWGLDENVEITLEANPTSVEAGKFKGFRQAGVNRVSLGVQSLNPESLAFLGRQHDVDEALRAVQLAADIFPRYSFDLIYALPNQTPEQWQQELQHALRHAGDHLSLYQLTIEENTAFHHAYHTQKAFALPEDSQAATLYELTQAIMEDAGMPAYEISNHARPGQASRHNLSYWESREYAGIGPGAHGRIHANGQRIATQCIKSPERWLEAVARDGHGYELSEALTKTQAQEEKLMMGLRLREGFARADVPFIQPSAIEKLQRLGMLEAGEARVCTTPQGRLVLNAVIAELLA